MTSRIEGNYIYSLGNTEKWQEQRRLDMQFIGGLMKLAEQFPEVFSGRAIHEIVSGLPTFKKGKEAATSAV